MRVVIFTQYFPPEVGATQTRMEVFARSLADADHDVTVVCEVPNHPRGVIPPEWRGRFVHRSCEDGYEVIRVWVYASPAKSFWRRIAFYGTYATNALMASLTMVHRRPDVVFATSPPLPVLASALAAATVWRRPLMIDVRDIWPAVGVALGELRGRRPVEWAQRLERLLYRRAAAVSCVTPGFVEHVIANGAAPEKVYLLPNGTLPEVFRPGVGGRDVRDRLGIAHRFVVGYVGLHGIAQGLHAVLDAAELLAENADVAFLLVGDGPVKADLMADASARGLGNVVFADQVPLAEAAQVIAACDVMVVPLRRHEVLKTFVPSKLFDYLACAKPVVVMADGEARALVEDSGSGLYVEPEDAHGLEKAVRWLQENPAERAAMGARARSFVCRSYDRHDVARRHEEILAELSGQVRV